MEIKSDYSIFDYTNLMQQNSDQMSKSALSNAIDLLSNGEHKRALQEFQRSIALSPYNDNIIETYDYMASAYLQLGDTRSAEKAYKTAISLDPQREDMYLSLGHLYFSEDNFDQAKNAYKAAVNVYPSSETYYSLAHCCLGMESLDEAERYFEKVVRMEPESENGYYGLGMTYAKQDRNDEAIEQFKKALTINPDFDDARVEMGYAFADAGDMESANEQYEILEENESSLSSLLYAYMYKVDQPKFKSAYKGNFDWEYSMRTPIIALNSYLRTAGETQNFTVQFSFNKDMDVKSIQDTANWSISRSSGYGVSAYNFGLKMNSRETEVPDKPQNVLYDPSSRTASVTFALSQNETGNGIIDPGHIVFSFSGTDEFGNEMSEDYDSYCGFNGFA